MSAEMPDLTNEEQQELVAKLAEFRNSLSPRQQQALTAIVSQAKSVLEEVKGYDDLAGNRPTQIHSNFGLLATGLGVGPMSVGTAGIDPGVVAAESTGPFPPLSRRD